MSLSGLTGQSSLFFWIPACAGMTTLLINTLQMKEALKLTILTLFYTHITFKAKHIFQPLFQFNQLFFGLAAAGILPDVPA